MRTGSSAKRLRWLRAIGAIGLVAGLLAPAAAQAPNGWDWAKRLNDTHEDAALAIAVDSAGQTMYTAGKADRGLQRFSGGGNTNTGTDGYLVKQRLNGDHLWQFAIGGSGDDGIAGVCLDPLGNVYITGWFSGNNASFEGASGESKFLTSSGGRDLFVAKYSAAGELQWRTRVGGPLDEVGTDICYSGGKLFVTGSYRSSISTLPGVTSLKAVLLAFNPTNGNQLWQFYGSNGEHSSFNAVAADAEKVYVIGDYKGSAYNYSGSNTASTTMAPPAGQGRSAQIVALNHDGELSWAKVVSNPMEDLIHATAIAVGHAGLYIGGSTHNGSVFPGGVPLTFPTSVHDMGYVARLDKHTGSTEFIAPFTGSADHVQVVRGIAVDSHEDVLVTGTYHTTANYLDQITFSGSSTEQIFVVKATRHGLVKWANTPAGYGPDRANGIATDRAGKVAIAGAYSGLIDFLTPWTGNSTDNLFMAVMTDHDHAVESFHDPSNFRDLGPVCETDGPIDLNDLLLPVRYGQIPVTNGVISTSGATVEIDLGDTIPAGEHVIIGWTKTSTGSASLNVSGTLNTALGYTHLGTVSTNSTDYTVSGVAVSGPVRHIRLTRNSGTMVVEDLYYSFGSAPDGVWSGDGVTGHLFDPSGLAGSAVVRYDAHSQSTERTVSVSAAPTAGGIDGGGIACPGATVELALNGATGQFITWYVQYANDPEWHGDAANTDTYSLDNLDQGAKVFATVSSPGCAPAHSDTISVFPQDTEPPVFIDCPNDTIVYMTASGCGVQVVYDPPTATDNCSEPTIQVEDAAHQPGQTFPLGTTIVVYQASDDEGNTASCEFKITVMDTIMPAISCPDDINTGTNLGCVATELDLGTPVATDNCNHFTVSSNAPAQFPMGSNTVTWIITDAAGNTASCEQTITVIDDVPPTITCPDQVEVFTDSGCGASSVFLGTADVWDNCATTVSTNNAPSFFPLDTTTVTWTVGDGHGNQASCTQLVIVVDNVAPTITCPDPVTVTTNTGCTATGVELGTPVTNDNCAVDEVWNNAPAAFGVGNTTVLWTVADSKGNTASCNQTVIVVDDVTPSITCPDTVKAFANTGCTAINLDLGTPVTADNCGVASVTNDAPTAFPLGETVVTWTVTDNSGNTSTCEQIVEVIDNVPPSITCPGAIITQTNGGCTATGVSLDTPVASDNCGTPVLTNDAPTVFPLGVTTVTWTATDGSGNTSTCTQKVTVVDNQPPVAHCQPVSIILDADGVATVTAAQVDNGSTDNCTVADIILTTTAYHAVGTYIDTLIVIDAAGNSDTCFATITVLDDIAPTAVCNDLILYLDANGQASITADDLDGGSFDNGEIVAMAASQTFFTCDDLGNNDVTLTVTDDGGNTNSCIATVTVRDTITPTITCPPAITLSADADCYVVNPLLGAPVTNDNCDDLSVINNVPPAFLLGETTITWMVADGDGNTANCTQEVTVIDDTPPVAQCKPVSIVLDADGIATVTATQVDNGSTDNCTVADIILTTTAYYAVGTYIDTLIVIDAAGNSDTCFATITVLDENAPTAVCNDLTLYLDADGQATITATDLDGGSFDNGEIVAMDASQTVFTCDDLGLNDVMLTVTDDGGNTNFCVANVTVMDTIAPTITCPEDLTLSTGAECTVVNPALGTPVASDNCSGFAVTNDALAALPLGPNTVTWTVTDAGGNTASCTQEITVIDDTPPVAQCKPVSVALDAHGVATVTAAQVDNGSTDNCTVAELILTTTAYHAVGTYIDTLIVIDAAGNSDTCFATITVLDENAPTAICNDLTLYLDADGQATITADELDGGSFDNGEIVAMDASQTVFACDDLGQNDVTLTVTDDGGNTNFCIATVTVLDTITPTINCPSDLTLSAGADCSVENPVLGTPVASDNCGGFAVANDALTALLLGPNTVTWTVTDAGGNAASCTQEVTVIDDTPPVAECKPVSIVLDADGMATVTAAQVDNGSSDNCTVADIILTTTTYHAVGTYIDTLIVIDAAGNSDTCFATITVVDENAPTAVCNDLTLYLDAYGQATIAADDLDGGSFDNGEIVAMEASQTVFTCDDLGNNDVTLMVTDDGGNTNFCIANVTVLDTIAPNTDGFATASFCPDGEAQALSAFITEDLATNGSWTAPDGTPFSGEFDPATGQPGLYTYAAPSLTSCSTDTFRVDVELYPPSFAGNDTSLTLCSNGPEVDLADLLPGADPNGTWSMGSSLFDPAVGSSTVHYIATNDHGCAPDTAFVAVTVLPAPHAGTDANLEICGDATAVDLFTVLGDSPDAGGWWTAPDGSPFAGLFNPAQHDTGDYTYTVDGAAPCSSSSATVTITLVEAPSAAWTAPGPICASADAIDLTPYVTGAAGGTWSGSGISNGHYFDPGAISISGASIEVELVYTVSVAGCSGSASGTITVDAMPVADAGSDASVCGLEHVLTPILTIGTGTWSTSGSASIADPNASHSAVSTDATGNQTFVWTVVNGTCTATDDVLVTFHLPEELTVLDAGGDQLQDIITTMELNGRADGATESWWSVVHGHGVFDDANALETRVHDLAIGENVLVLAARVGSCPAERDTVILTVRGLVVPTGFSPNGDGVNDRYMIRGLEELPPTSLHVYDRWGNQVYHADPYRNDWNGHGDNGQLLMDGTYFGIVTIAGQEPWKGNITLKR